MTESELDFKVHECRQEVEKAISNYNSWVEMLNRERREQSPMSELAPYIKGYKLIKG